MTDQKKSFEVNFLVKKCELLDFSIVVTFFGWMGDKNLLVGGGGVIQIIID